MDIPFQNRELSWLSFNARVLEEALKPTNPVLERLKFLAITASNLDEFFMVRVAYLHDWSKDKSARADSSGLSPKAQLEATLTRSREFIREQYACLDRLLGDLGAAGLTFLSVGDLNAEQREAMRNLFFDEVLPVLTPLAVDPSRPFPFLSNKSLNIAVRLAGQDGQEYFAIVQAPSILPRFLPVKAAEGWAFLPLERLISHYLYEVFSLYAIQAHGVFRITRSADFDADDDADDLMIEMERTIKRRKRGRPIRLELEEGMDSALREFIVERLDISRRFAVDIPGFLDLSALMKVAEVEGGQALRLPPIAPVQAADFCGFSDPFEAIQKRDRMVHHPYESFEHVANFIRAAAEDENVLAIKQTLYRVSGKSEIIDALVHAVELGKQVTVLVELKARFDEENNIQWAKRLERAGCHVIYGLTGLKTHCKITLVVRRERSGIRRYLHLGTGNYNGSTARVYTDIGMFTCRAAFGADASALFNHLTGYSKAPEYSKLVTAPENMKPFFLRMIDAEIANARRNLVCGIAIKVNSLLDEPIINKLYEASNAGVPVRLIIRGICALIPGVPGYSENIRVRSIVGQLLEHSRIYAFENGGDPKVYAGSADLMPRNLDRRVELIFPVEDPALRQRMLDIMELMWSDNVNAREQDAQGEYIAVEAEGAVVNAQRELHRIAREDLRRAQAEQDA